MKTLKYAQDLIKTNNPHCRAGFNSFINGDTMPVRTDYSSGEEWYSRLQGYEYAQKMSKENAIAFTHIFKCNRERCHPFKYGGFFVCNHCGQKEVDQKWWQIQVEKDGDQFCCHGLDFINLQESDNVAFGNTFDEAIANYHKIMICKN